ncbi:hypothetical protein [uncultured Thiodictyon sp.]|jgi:hypothetical protein|uniref:hypothetical protein n=1 Tax=uncultured Thiodictyon sp. TaxID=1846217 RepID=UPI0025D82295|nr:hypothetical protein [uncultured Thiodictyon sp.]
MNRDIVSHLPDADMQAAPAALLRGGRRARELARQTGTGVVMQGGARVEDTSAADTQADAAALWVATWSGCLAGREQPNEDDERLKYVLNKHLR